jgi:hypothetical protein
VLGPWYYTPLQIREWTVGTEFRRKHTEEELYAYLSYLSGFGYTLKSEMVGSFEMLVATLGNARDNRLRDCSLNLHEDENFKSHNFLKSFKMSRQGNCELRTC